MSDVCFLPSRKLARLIRARMISATEVVKAFIAHASLRRSSIAAGLPIAYKDVIPTKGNGGNTGENTLDSRFPCGSSVPSGVNPP